MGNCGEPSENARKARTRRVFYLRVTESDETLTVKPSAVVCISKPSYFTELCSNKIRCVFICPMKIVQIEFRHAPSTLIPYKKVLLKYSAQTPNSQPHGCKQTLKQPRVPANQMNFSSRDGAGCAHQRPPSAI